MTLKAPLSLQEQKAVKFTKTYYGLIMQEMVLFLVILNPFAQVLYLMELINRLQPGDFFIVHLKASLMSFLIFLLFALVGENFIMKHVFQVRLASLQIFGGIIMLFIAFRYILKGPGSNVLFKGDISDLAPNISLPYMVGPGTIWAAILIGRKHTMLETTAAISIVLLINLTMVLGYQQLNNRLSKKNENVLGKYFSILMRTNALFIGAIAVEMMLTGFESVFLSK